MADKLDQLVKGQPPPDISPAHVAQSARANAPPTSIVSAHLPDSSQYTTNNNNNNNNNDPRDTLPSSPPQIYLNLLILESSLRLQYLSLRARLRLHLLLLAVLSAWISAFTYLLFFRPREDGSGVGGSVYWVVESTEKLGWCGGVVTLCLFWGTGLYERGVRWPRKFVSTTNRGLRGFNMKVVVTKGSMLSEMGGWLSMLDPLGWFREERVNFQILPKDIETGAARENWKLQAARHGLIEEDIAPSGDVLKLLLLPKPFSPDFREGWETCRMEYWEKENARRLELRKVLTARHREVMRSKGGWFGWMGWRGLEVSRVFSSKSRREMDLERLAISDKGDRLKEKHRREDQLRAASHSRSSSRSSTPGDGDSRPGTADGLRTQKIRRGSSAASTTRRPHKRAGSLQMSRLSATETLLDDQPAKRASTVSIDSDLGEVDEKQLKKEEGDGLMPTFTNDIKAEPDEAS